MHNRRVKFLLQPAQSPDLNTLDLGAWWSLETDVNALRYDPEWFLRKDKPAELLADLNETIMKSWKSWKTFCMLNQLHDTLHQNCWTVLTSRSRNDYDRRSASCNPPAEQLKMHLLQARYDPLWSEAVQFQQEHNQCS